RRRDQGQKRCHSRPWTRSSGSGGRRAAGRIAAAVRARRGLSRPQGKHQLPAAPAGVGRFGEQDRGGAPVLQQRGRRVQRHPRELPRCLVRQRDGLRAAGVLQSGGRRTRRGDQGSRGEILTKSRSGRRLGAMFRAYGLYTHIRANRIRSVLLLIGFVALLHALLFSILLLINAFGGGTFEEIVARAVDQFAGSWPVAMLAAGVWFLISWFFHQRLISYATGARGISRREAPRLYNVLENLCISRGIPMPALQIIETPALNAYAAGLKEGEYVIAVTRGLMETLSDDELEAVLGHELTHIRN